MLKTFIKNKKNSRNFKTKLSSLLFYEIKYEKI